MKLKHTDQSRLVGVQSGRQPIFCEVKGCVNAGKSYRFEMPNEWPEYFICEEHREEWLFKVKEAVGLRQQK